MPNSVNLLPHSLAFNFHHSCRSNGISRSFFFTSFASSFAESCDGLFYAQDPAEQVKLLLIVIKLAGLEDLHVPFMKSLCCTC